MTINLSKSKSKSQLPFQIAISLQVFSANSKMSVFLGSRTYIGIYTMKTDSFEPFFLNFSINWNSARWNIMFCVQMRHWKSIGFFMTSTIANFDWSISVNITSCANAFHFDIKNGKIIRGFPFKFATQNRKQLRPEKEIANLNHIFSIKISTFPNLHKNPKVAVLLVLRFKCCELQLRAWTQICQNRIKNNAKFDRGFQSKQLQNGIAMLAVFLTYFFDAFSQYLVHKNTKK